MGAEMAREVDDLLRIAGDLFARPRLKSMVSAALSGRCPEQAAALEPLVADVTGRIAPDVDRANADGRLIARTVLRGLSTLLDEQAMIEAGVAAPIPQAFAMPSRPVVPSPQLPTATTPFLARWSEFETSKVVEGEWKRDTATNARSARNLFEAFHGPIPAGIVDRELIGRFRAQLFRLPKGYDKAKRWRGLPLPDVIAAAAQANASASASDHVPLLKLRTIDKHFSNLLEYWAWITKNGHLPATTENPFTGFIQPKAKGKSARHERNAWPQAMVTKLFTSPVWSGCYSLHRRSRPGAHIYRDARFWAPLLGRSLGARENELCSLKVGDIKFIDGIAVLSINDSKTPGSERDLPLPETILLMGFLEYRWYGRSPDEALFPELIAQGVEQRQAVALSSWFTVYRKAIDCYALLVDFHSFRHNVSTDLQNMEGLNMGWADEITGHESDIRKSERSRYTKGVYLHHLKDTVDRIDIGVNLDHLAFDGKFGEPAPGAAQEISRFVALAERDMAGKAGRIR